MIGHKHGPLLLTGLQAFNLLADSVAKVISNINSYTNTQMYAEGRPLDAEALAQEAPVFAATTHCQTALWRICLS